MRLQRIPVASLPLIFICSKCEKTIRQSTATAWADLDAKAETYLCDACAHQAAMDLNPPPMDTPDEHEEETPVEITYCVNVWAERDRIHIHLVDSNDKTIAEWWDAEAESMIEDGYFQGGRNLKQSVLDYARQSLIVPKDARLT